jgi:hypothetical protein
MKTLIVATLVAFGIAGSASATENKKELKYNGEFSGSVVSTEIDVNGDGLRAVLFLVIGKTTLGRTDVQTLLEFVPTGPGICANGNPGLLLTAIHGTGTIRFEQRDGDLILVKAGETNACVDPSTGQQFVSAQLNFVGGTGRFEQASGSIQVSSVTQGLFQDASLRLFGASVGEFKGSIIVVKKF